jgi:E3 SUMO-protein ligase NSE2
MSNNRRLVSRQRRNEESSPASRPRQRESEAAPRQPTALPPYEPPTCPLTETAKRQLDDLRVNQDHTKYKKHLNNAITSITNCAMETNERLHARKDRVQKLAEKRLHQGTEDDQKMDEYVEAERYAEHLEKKVSDITTQAEKALRDLIDYGDELTMQDTIMKEVHGNIEAPLAGQRQNRQRVEGESEDSEDLAPDPDILSAVELFKQAKEDYAAEYSSKTMRARYYILHFDMSIEAKS